MYLLTAGLRNNELEELDRIIHISTSL